ncbi:hypothetical protein Tsubulata_020043, partial [Turnera subulata]
LLPNPYPTKEPSQPSHPQVRCCCLLSTPLSASGFKVLQVAALIKSTATSRIPQILKSS